MEATVDLGFAVCDCLVSDLYVYLSLVFLLVIIGGFAYWFGGSLLFFITFLYFILIIYF